MVNHDLHFHNKNNSYDIQFHYFECENNNLEIKVQIALCPQFYINEKKKKSPFAFLNHIFVKFKVKFKNV